MLLFVLNDIQHLLHSPSADVIQGLRHRRQRRFDPLTHLDIIEADHGYIPWNTQTQVVDRAHHHKSLLVIRRKDRINVFFPFEQVANIRIQLLFIVTVE